MSAKTLREGLTALGVVLSLVFVGIEIRQNTVAIRSSTQSELAVSSRDLLMGIASSPELASAWRRWLAGEELDPDQELMAGLTLASYLRGIENVFLQVESGAVDDDALRGYGFVAIRGVAQSPYFEGFWESARGGFDSGFVSALEAELGAPR